MPTLRGSLQAGREKAARLSQSLWPKYNGSKSPSSASSEAGSAAPSVRALLANKRHQDASQPSSRPLSDFVLDAFFKDKGKRKSNDLSRQSSLKKPEPRSREDSLTSKRAYDPQGSIGPKKPARKRHASDTVLPTPVHVQVQTVSHMVTTQVTQTRGTSLDEPRVRGEAQQQYLRPRANSQTRLDVPAVYRARNEYVVQGDSPLDHLDEFFSRLSPTSVRATARNLHHRGYAVDEDTLVATLRSQFQRVISFRERAIIKRHFLNKNGAPSAGVDERVVALYETLSLYTSYRPLIRTRFCEALAALPAKRFDGRITPLLHVISGGDWSSADWEPAIALAVRLCPETFSMNTFASFVDWLGQMCPQGFETLSAAGLDVRDVIEERAQREIEERHVQRFVDLLAMLAELPPTWAAEAGALCEFLLPKELFVGRLDMAMADLTKLLDLADVAAPLTPAGWRPAARASLLKSLVALNAQQQERLEIFADMLKEDIERKLKAPIAPAHGQLWSSLLTTIARLQFGRFEPCVHEVATTLHLSPRPQSQRELLESLVVIAERALLHQLGRHRVSRAREPRTSFGDKPLTIVAER